MNYLIMKYFETWKIVHPYTEDFRNSIIQFTKVDLNWFFDQWLETEKRIDYGVTHKNNTVTSQDTVGCTNRFYNISMMEKFMIITFQIIGLLRKQISYLKNMLGFINQNMKLH